MFCLLCSLIEGYSPDGPPIEASVLNTMATRCATRERTTTATRPGLRSAIFQVHKKDLYRQRRASGKDAHTFSFHLVNN